ncbi:astakine [Anabrus simplex]|uniref:astakine n=1 Tax=Anabrus simplex TaxID=316456 RepID=UPI0035A322DE
MSKLVLLVVMLLMIASAHSSRPSYIECQDSKECGPGSCCAIGANRYSVPMCQRMHEVGESCRGRGQEPMNTTVGYPDQSKVELTNVYWLFCPCADGLVCEKPSSTCQPKE